MIMLKRRALNNEVLRGAEHVQYGICIENRPSDLPAHLSHLPDGCRNNSPHQEGIEIGDSEKLN